MAPERLRLVQVGACPRNYLQIQSHLVAELLQLGHKHQVNHSLPPSRSHRSLRAQQTRLLCFRSKVVLWSLRPARCCDALRAPQMEPHFKRFGQRHGAIKAASCAALSGIPSFNGFMAVQTQLGRFQNGTHLFLSSLCDTARPGTKGPAEMINSVW